MLDANLGGHRPRPGANALVRDLWQKADVGRFEGRYEAKVAPHGVVMARVTPRL